MKLLKQLIITFLPWSFYAVLINQWQINIRSACLICITMQIITGYKYLKKLFVINWTILISFMIILYLNKISSVKLVQNDPWILSSFLLAVVSWTSMILKRPIMQQYAKQDVSADKWKTPLFIKISTILTWIWSIIFSGNFMLHLLMLVNPSQFTILLLTGYGATLFGILFSALFPSYSKQKYAAKKSVAA